MGEFADFDLDRSTARAWSVFQARLADHLAAIADDELCLIEMDAGLDDGSTGTTPYVQYCAWGDDLMRSEVSSNKYLADAFQLGPEQEEAIVQIGWGRPTYVDDADADSGSANFFLDIERDQADRLAVMSVRVLRDVLGIAHPAFLLVSAGAGGEHPDLGIPAAVHEATPQENEPLAIEPTGPEHLGELVDAALTPFFGQAPAHDEDGDIPVAHGSSLLFVRVSDTAPIIEVFGTLVRNVERTNEIDAAVAEINRSTDMIKLISLDDSVIAVGHLLAMPFVPVHLRELLSYLSQTADRLDDDLVTRLGGTRALEEEPELAEVKDTDNTQLAPELLTLLHLDPEGAGVDADLAASVCNYDRDLVLAFLRESSEQEIAWRSSHDDALVDGDREEAEACAHEARAWATTVETLRQALRVIVERERDSGS